MHRVPHALAAVSMTACESPASKVDLAMVASSSGCLAVVARSASSRPVPRSSIEFVQPTDRCYKRGIYGCLSNMDDERMSRTAHRAPRPNRCQCTVLASTHVSEPVLNRSERNLKCLISPTTLRSPLTRSRSTPSILPIPSIPPTLSIRTHPTIRGLRPVPRSQASLGDRINSLG